MYKRNAQGWLKHIDFILWDILVLQAAFVLGYMIRHGWGLWPYALQTYRSLAIVLSAADLLVCVVFNTMHSVMKRGYLRELTETVKQVALVLLFMTLYLFSVQAGDVYSRISIYLTSGFHLVLGYSFRMLWKAVLRRISRGRSKSTMILVAEEAAVQEILEKTDEMDGFEYAGVVLSDRDAKGECIKGVQVVANLSDAADYICREWVDEVLVCPQDLSDFKLPAYGNIESIMEDTDGDRKSAQPEDTGEQSGTARLIAQCREMAVPVHLHLPIASAGGKSFVEKVGGFNVLTIASNSAGPGQLVLKRLLDILGGLFGSLAAVILIAVLGPWIKKESPGPVLFSQIRIGQNGKKFRFYKIRSMYMDAEKRKAELQAQNRVSDGLMFKMDFDPRIIGNRIVDGKQVTGIGEKIRKWSLDEFPQFFNVLKGDMSLVGTRPPTEDEWDKYKYHHRARLAAKPGLTGLWQVSGRSEITDFEEVVKLDTEYINNWSVGLDLKILFKTVKTVLSRDGAM